MKLHRAMCGIALAMVAAFLSPAHGKGATDDSQRLVLGLKTGCVEYGMQDVFGFSVALKNAGRSDVVIYSQLGWGLLGGMILRITDLHGKVIYPKYLDHDFPPPPGPDDHDLFAKLFPDHSLGVSRQDPVAELFPGPGDYVVAVDYASPVLRGSAFVKEDVWAREAGLISSNPVRIKIGLNSACAKAQSGA